MPKPDESVCQTEKIEGKKGEAKREKRVRDWQGKRPRLIIGSLISRVRSTTTFHWRARRTCLLWRRRWFYDGIRVWKVQEGRWIGRTQVTRPMSICQRLMRFWIWWTSYRFGPIPSYRLEDEFFVSIYLSPTVRSCRLSLSPFFFLPIILSYLGGSRVSVSFDFLGAEFFFFLITVFLIMVLVT